jgi:hypothetical protein
MGWAQNGFSVTIDLRNALERNLHIACTEFSRTRRWPLVVRSD